MPEFLLEEMADGGVQRKALPASAAPWCLQPERHVLGWRVLVPSFIINSVPSAHK